MEIKFKVENWSDIRDKYFKIMLTPELAKDMGLNLVREDGIWWIEVNKDKKENGR